MKYVIFTLSLFFCVLSYGQQTQLTGPKFKKAKISERYPAKGKVVLQSNKEKLQGPAAKNKKPMALKDQKTQPIAFKKRTPVYGPKAKNRKPWQ
ncbi:hypothetical protein ACFQ1M_05570 [Sungkyunkwania multivorans]|uniref:Uncharacterized protein n=1 Tax=Sungkyunkwania multivorans TaxID=1173618 RepID=A0ABW3CV69_9FLAO